MSKNILFYGCLLLVLSSCLVYARCEDNEPEKDLSVRGKIWVDGKEYAEDSCDREIDPNMMYEWSCENDAPVVEKVYCSPLGLVCSLGRCIEKSSLECIDSDVANDISVAGRVTISRELAGIDFCDGDTLVQLGCGDYYSISYETYHCSNDGKFCSEGICKSCPNGSIYTNKGCHVPDFDADGIPDIGDDVCLDTSPGDATNERGCSCEQGAKAVYLEKSGRQVMVNCADQADLGISICPDGQERHCCNSIKDKDEFLVDCGGSDCELCGGICSQIINGGDLDVLLVPISYSSSEDISVAYNLQEWKSRAAMEATRLAVTPPFDMGQVTVWRLDMFKINQNFEASLNSRDLTQEVLAALYNTNGKFFNREYPMLCPSIDLVYFLPTSYERSFAFGSSGVAVIYQDFQDVNVITHETGHSFCGLDDEYIEEGKKIDPVGSINCDGSPENISVNSTAILEGMPQLRCKWYDEFPDAGCIAGCGYSSLFYRPQNDFEDSMMNGNYQIGPTDSGTGSWNQVGYHRCRTLVENYGT